MSEKVNNEVPPPVAEVEDMDNLKNVSGVPEELFVDPEEEKALVKKLDRVIMPIMAIVYFFQCALSVFVSPCRAASNLETI